MAVEIYEIIDQNGNHNPIRDLAAFPRSEQAVLGAKNLLDFGSYKTTATRCSYTYTKSTGTYEITVTDASNNAQLEITIPAAELAPYAGKGIRFSAEEIIKSDEDMNPYFVLYDGASPLGGTFGNIFTFTVPDSFTSTNLLLVLRVNQGQSASVGDVMSYKGVMCALQTTPDIDFVPHAMTNLQITREFEEPNLVFTEAETHNNVSNIIVKGIKFGTARILSISAKIDTVLSDYVVIGNISGIKLPSNLTYPTNTSEPRVRIDTNGDIRVYSQMANDKINFTVIL